MTSPKGATAWLVLAAGLLASAAAAGPKEPVRAPEWAQLPPGVLRVAPAAPPVLAARDTWTNLFTEDFEGTFPGAWGLLNQGLAGDVGWGVWDCWSGDTPTRSAGCAAGGALAISCGDPYPDDVRTWMIRGPFDLSDPALTAAEVRCKINLNSETDYDRLSVMASTDGQQFWGNSFTGATVQDVVFDLTTVPELGNLLGESQVWIALIFTSDQSINMANGAQVDDVVLRVASAGAVNVPPLVSVVAPDGGETWTAGSQREITWTADDPDGGPQPLSVDLAWSANGGGAWQPIATGLADDGAHTWTVPDQLTGAARVRVTVTDGEAAVSDASDADFAIVASQPGDNTFTVGDATGVSGTSVTVALELANETAVDGAQLDLLYDASVASFTGAVPAGRGADLTVGSHVVSDGRARVVLYHDDDASLPAGDGLVANLIFEITGQAGENTAVMPADIILSDPDGAALGVGGDQGTITVAAATEVPALQIAVLKNPGRVRTLQIIVNVTRGSGNAPVVTAGGASVAMASLGANRWAGAHAAATGAGSVSIVALDTNEAGPGQSQVTVNF